MSFRNFDELEISTQTVIADSNMMMDIEEFFHKIPIDDVKSGGDGEIIPAVDCCHALQRPPPGKAKPKRSKQNIFLPSEMSPEDVHVTEMIAEPAYQMNRLSEDAMWIRLLPSVRCRAMYFKNEIKIHPSMNFQARERYFRNALNVVLSIGNKMVNFKLSKNGKFQLTGCKYLWHAQVCVVAFFQRIREWCPERVSPCVRISFQTVMTNVDFNIGHTIDRARLDEKINAETTYYSLLETSFGYTGVNIKFPIPPDWWKIMKVPVVSICSGEKESIVCDDLIFDCTLQDTDRQRFRVKQKYNTFLVFHSGNVIMSGMSPQLMKADYDIFTDFLTQWSKDIRERIRKRSDE